jgi:hypothetical protein
MLRRLETVSLGTWVPATSTILDFGFRFPKSDMAARKTEISISGPSFILQHANQRDVCPRAHVGETLKD